MPSKDVVREMRTVARFEELANRQPLFCKILHFLRHPGVPEQLGLSKSTSDGELLRALGDTKSPSNLLKSFGVDLGTAIRAEASLQYVIDSELKSSSSRHLQQQRTFQEEQPGFCQRYGGWIALVLASVLILGAMALLGLAVWMEVEELEYSFLDRTWTAAHLFIGASALGVLSIMIVIARLCCICCSCRCCSSCYSSLRSCCSCRWCGKLWRARDSGDNEDAPVKQELSEVQVVALRQLSRQFSHLPPEHLPEQFTTGPLSEQLALQNTADQSPKASSGHQQLALWDADTAGSQMQVASPEAYRMGETAAHNQIEAMPMLHMPSVASTTYSGFKSVSFEPDNSDPSMQPAVVAVANKAPPAVSDPAWHSPQTHSFARLFMGLHQERQPTPDEENMTEAERFKHMAEQMRAEREKPAAQVTFPQYADDVVGHPVAELNEFRHRPLCSQFYIDTMFQSKPVYPKWHPDSKQSRKHKEELSALAGTKPTRDPLKPIVKPMRRPISGISFASTYMMSPRSSGEWSSTGNQALGLNHPESFASASPPSFQGDSSSMLSPRSTISNRTSNFGNVMMGNTAPGQFPYRPQPIGPETEALKASLPAGSLRNAAQA